MSREKQIEKMAERIYGNGITHDTAFHEDCRSIARDLYEAGYRKQEWISVEDKLPETKLQTITFKDVEIGDGGESTSLGTEESVEAQVSDLVLIISEHPKGAYYDIDRTVNGAWANNWWVTHWMPLPQPPKMKGGAE